MSQYMYRGDGLMAITQELYEDLYGNVCDLSNMTYDELLELNYSEEVQLAKNVLTFPPFSEERSSYMRFANKKIMQIAFWKKEKSGSLTIYETNRSYGATDASIAMLQRIINIHHTAGTVFTFYEAGVGKGSALKTVAQDGLKIYGCDVFLSEEAKELAGTRSNIHLIEADLYLALDTMEDSSIDFFYADNVLEHLPPDEYNETIKKIAAKMKTGGTFFAIIPNSYAGPHDISKHFITAGERAQGFHYMEQPFSDNVSIFRNNGLELSGLCVQGLDEKIIYLPAFNFLNTIKVRMESLLGKIRRPGLRKLLFKKLGYSIYIMRKV